jgi:beta-phosphoglucomutase-like phosphatase (HAD superfamily)
MVEYVFLFDIDGVVAETPHEESWREAAIEYGLVEKDFNFKEFYQKYVAGIPGVKGAEAILEERGYFKQKNILDSFEREKESVKFREIKQKILERHLDEGKFRLFSDIINIIIEAKNNKIPIAAVSSSENSEKILKKSGIYSIFDSHVLGAIKHRVKNKEELYTIAFGKLLEKHNLNEIPYPIVFEDADKVIEALKKTGYKCIGIARERLTTSESLVLKGADFAYNETELKQKGFNGIINDLKNLVFS